MSPATEFTWALASTLTPMLKLVPLPPVPSMVIVAASNLLVPVDSTTALLDTRTP